RARAGHDARPLPRERLRDGEAYPLAGPGDDRDLVCELELHVSTLLNRSPRLLILDWHAHRAGARNSEPQSLPTMAAIWRIPPSDQGVVVTLRSSRSNRSTNSCASGRTRSDSTPGIAPRWHQTMRPSERSTTHAIPSRIRNVFCGPSTLATA